MDRQLSSWSWLLVGILVFGSVYGRDYKRIASAVRQVDCEELVEQCFALLSQRCAAEIAGGDSDTNGILVCCDEVFQILDCFAGELDGCLPPQVINIIRDSERDCEARQTGVPTTPPSPTENANKITTFPPAEIATEVPTGAPTDGPAEAPAESTPEVPSETLTVSPSGAPSGTPSGGATETPTEVPIVAPSATPTEASTDLSTDEPPDSSVENSSSPNVSPSATTSPSPISSPACFPGEATVFLLDGREKPMKFLQAGDNVMVAGGDFSDVYAFGHKDPAQDADFVRIETESGHAIEVSGSHFVLINGELVLAGKVQVGDSLTVTGLGKSRVGALSIVHRSGVYNPHTLDGTIVVNGIEVSCHTETVKPFVSDFLMAIPRILYRLGLNEPLGSMLYKSTPTYVHLILRKMRISAAYT